MKLTEYKIPIAAGLMVLAALHSSLDSQLAKDVTAGVGGLLALGVVAAFLTRN